MVTRTRLNYYVHRTLRRLLGVGLLPYRRDVVFGRQDLTFQSLAIVLYLPPGLALKKFYIVLTSHVCVLYSSHGKQQLLLYTLSDWLCITEVERVYCAVRTEFLYRVSQEECARLREGVPYVKVYRYNPKHLYPKLNGYGDNGQRKVWSSCGSSCQLTILSISVLECGVI